MKPEEAKKIAEAIAIGVSIGVSIGCGAGGARYENMIDTIKNHLTTDPAAPVGKEYRAGEWVPPEEWEYWYITDGGEITDSVNTRHAIDSYHFSQGNVFPTEAIAEAAKKHAEFWRAFDMADEGVGFSFFASKIGMSYYLVGEGVQEGKPKFATEERARSWVDSHGGEAYVSEMLTKGRVFRFKWGGE